MPDDSPYAIAKKIVSGEQTSYQCLIAWKWRSLGRASFWNFGVVESASDRVQHPTLLRDDVAERRTAVCKRNLEQVTNLPFLSLSHEECEDA